MDTGQRALDTAAAMLGRKMYTCKELCDRLIKKGFLKEHAEEAVARLIEAGYLDDFRYAQLYIEDAVRLGAKGMYRIRQELYQKGISDSIIAKAMEESETDERAALYEYVAARHLFDHIHSRRDLEKVKARLVRRGYSLRDIQSVIEKAEISMEEI